MMNDRRIALARFGGYLILGGLLGGIAAALYLLLTPKTYQANTDLKIEVRLQRTDLLNTNSVYAPPDPEAVPRELEYIRSEAIRSQVITNLQLAQRWGFRYKQGAVLSSNEVRTLFHQKAAIDKLPGSAIIRVKVTSDEPEETASIANEISRLYLTQRAAERKATAESKFAALQKQWEEQAQKLAEAQDEAKKLRFQILMTQATNPAVVMDPEGLVHLQQKRADLETDYVRQQNLIKYLKGLDTDKLRQVFPTMTTNEMVLKTMDQVVAAKAELAFSTTNSGPTSPETKHAAETLAELNKRADALIATTLGQQSIGVTAIKAELDKTIDLLKHARPSSSTNKFTIDDPAYNKAISEVQKLQSENDQLKAQLDLSTDAALTPPVAAEILSTAHTPSEPISPDKPAAMKTIWAGLTVAVVGLLLIILAKGFKPESGPLPRRS
jgi:uncharacterized protein involved in exopolysaccharide biosynthesis